MILSLVYQIRRQLNKYGENYMTTVNNVINHGQVLTLSAIQNLIGKTIRCTSCEYDWNKVEVIYLTVCNVISEWHAAARPGGLYGNFKDSRYSNQQEYWEGYMTPSQIEDKKCRYKVLDADGNVWFTCDIRTEEKAFFGSDSDRFVFFVDPSIAN